MDRGEGDTKNPDRGPLLIISGEKDHTVPRAIAKASYKRQQRNPGVTEIEEMPGRGHSLTIDHGWREVADTALAFVEALRLTEVHQNVIQFRERVGELLAEHAPQQLAGLVERQLGAELDPSGVRAERSRCARSRGARPR